MIECKCGHKNSDEGKFCSNCGSPLSKKCAFCNTDVPASYKFCPSCGRSCADTPDLSSIMGGNVIGGDMHTTVIYNQEKERSKESSVNNVNKCHVCGKELSLSSKNTLRCSICGLWFCSDHIDIRTQMCQKCCENSLAEFEYVRHENGRYAITGLKNKNSLLIVVPNCVESIEDCAFEGCSAINVTLPSGLLKIGKRAFADCKELTSVAFPMTLKIIGDEAFKGCCKYNGTMGNGSVQVGDNAFEGTVSEKRKNDRVAFYKSSKQYINNIKRKIITVIPIIILLFIIIGIVLIINGIYREFESGNYRNNTKKDSLRNTSIHRSENISSDPAPTETESNMYESEMLFGSERETEYYPETQDFPETTYYPETQDEPVTPDYPETEYYPATTYYPETEDYPEMPDYPETTCYPETEDYPETEYYPETTCYPETEDHPVTEYYPETTCYPETEDYPVTEYYPSTTYYPESEYYDDTVNYYENPAR